MLIFNEITTLKEQHRREIGQRYRDLFNILTGFFEQGIEDGTIGQCNPTASSLSFFSSLQWPVVWLERIPPEDIPQAAESFIDICSKGLAVDTLSKVNKFPKLNAGQTIGFNREAQNQMKQEAFYRKGSDFFNQKGFKGTSLDELAASLSVTKGAFYYHISNKEDLLFQCFKRTLKLVTMMQDQASKDGRTGMEALQRSACYLLGIQNSIEGPLVRYNLLNSLSSERRRSIKLETSAVDSRFGIFISDGIKDKSIRDVDSFVAEEMLAGAIYSSMELQRWQSVEDMPSAAEDYFQVFFQGLKA